MIIFGLSVQLAGALPTGMRAAASVVLRAGGSSDTAVRAAIDAVRAAGSPGYTHGVVSTVERSATLD